MELWDAYDGNFNKIEGAYLLRGGENPNGYFHLVSEIIVRHRDGSWLLMQRDPRKPLGGMWEATAGGSALVGESPLDCARRELREETGIIPEDMTEIGRIFHYEHRAIYAEFLCVTDCEKDSIVLQDGETSAYRWVTRDELYNMSKRELATQRIQNFIRELRR